MDQNAHPLGLALNSVSVDLQFQSTICSIDDSYPQFIVSAVRDFIVKTYLPMEPIFVKKDITLPEVCTVHGVQLKKLGY